MAKEKTTHIFNKNHIEILKIEHPKMPVGKYPKLNTIYMENRYHGWYGIGGRYTKKTIETKKVSPLGFYYTSKVEEIVDNYNRPKRSTDDHNGERTVVVLTIPFDSDTEYQLKYYTRYNENEIKASEDGLRPWDICDGDGDFPDNMLDALVKECEKLFVMAVEKGHKEVMLPKWDRNERASIADVKKSVYRDLFGNANGPRFQTNEEKIIAHGFDPKYSFRKDKEKK